MAQVACDCGCVLCCVGAEGLQHSGVVEAYGESGGVPLLDELGSQLLCGVSEGWQLAVGVEDGRRMEIEQGGMDRLRMSVVKGGGEA